MAVCSIRYIDLNKDMIKILGCNFSYNKNLKEEKSLISL